jgi:hypothetical protein
MKFKPPQTGVCIVEGLPGSGKSFEAVVRLTRRIQSSRRPHFTNLPLRHRTLKEYLKLQGGERALQYVQPLTEEHFKSFIRRFAAFAELLEAQRAEEAHVSIEAVQREFVEELGPNIWRHERGGEKPNWIPFGSVILIDELHKWFPQERQKQNAELDEALRGFVTMHRHGLYLIELLTQNPMQIDIVFRRNCIEYVHCIDKRKLPFLFGIPLPIPAFFYQLYPAELLEQANGPFKPKPLRSWIRVPALNGGLIWRLYDSFSHVGGARRLNKAMEQTRQQIEGEHYVAGFDQKVDTMLRRRRWMVFGLVKWALIFGVCFLAYLQGSRSPNSAVAADSATESDVEAPELPRPNIGEAVRQRVAERHSAAVRQTAIARTQDVPRGRLAVIGRDYVVIDAKLLRVGEGHADLRLADIDVRERVTFWTDDDGGGALWFLGGEPVRLPREETAEGDADVDGADGEAGPATQPAPRPDRAAPAGGDQGGSARPEPAGGATTRPDGDFDD